jgi:hypothetical protein
MQIHATNEVKRFTAFFFRMLEKGVDVISISRVRVWKKTKSTSPAQPTSWLPGIQTDD